MTVPEMHVVTIVLNLPSVDMLKQQAAVDPWLESSLLLDTAKPEAVTEVAATLQRSGRELDAIYRDSWKTQHSLEGSFRNDTRGVYSPEIHQQALPAGFDAASEQLVDVGTRLSRVSAVLTDTMKGVQAAMTELTTTLDSRRKAYLDSVNEALGAGYANPDTIPPHSVIADLAPTLHARRTGTIAALTRAVDQAATTITKLVGDYEAVLNSTNQLITEQNTPADAYGARYNAVPGEPPADSRREPQGDEQRVRESDGAGPDDRSAPPEADSSPAAPDEGADDRYSDRADDQDSEQDADTTTYQSGDDADDDEAVGQDSGDSGDRTDDAGYAADQSDESNESGESGESDQPDRSDHEDSKRSDDEDSEQSDDEDSERSNLRQDSDADESTAQPDSTAAPGQTADALTDAGFAVTHPPAGQLPGTSASDLVVDGTPMAVCTPTGTDGPAEIQQQLQRLIHRDPFGPTATDRLVLDLQSSPLDARTVENALHTAPPLGLRELLVIDAQGEVSRLTPAV